MIELRNHYNLCMQEYHMKLLSPHSSGARIKPGSQVGFLAHQCSRRLCLGLVFITMIVSGCAPKPQMYLMPTPVVYEGALVDPFKHLGDNQQSTEMSIYYATNRSPRYIGETVMYGNGFDSTLHLGMATARFGYPETTWDELHAFSTSTGSREPLPVTITRVEEIAQVDKGNTSGRDGITALQTDFFARINAELAEVVDKEIMVYVHGAKVDFNNAAILTAEVDHFAGRDFAGIAFSWPSHQNILHYLMRTDVKRANNSSSALSNLLELLARHTDAEQINILAYSAGGKVVSKALFELRGLYPELNEQELKHKFRIGSVVFVAADIEVDVFLERIAAISEFSRQVVVSISDLDNALQAAKKFMGGSDRVGSVEAEEVEDQFFAKHSFNNVEVVDVSIGRELRGFDIVGHHYWYRHPWMSSDIIFLMRTDLPPSRRGLSETDRKRIWYLSEDYPVMIRKVAKKELGGQWQ